MTYRKINLSADALEKRRVYQIEYNRKRRRTPEGLAASKAAWARHAEKTPESKKREQARERNFRFRAKKLGVDTLSVKALIEKGCMICGETKMRSTKLRTLVLDHNHKTGAFRGILCMACNTSIGRFGDDPVMLDRAAKYLRGEL